MLLCSLLLVHVFVNFIGCDPTLQYAALIFRHGERAPLYRFTSVEARDYFQNRTGRLTERGEQQIVELGRFLMQKYDFASIQQISLHSASTLRCIQSAYALMDGMGLDGKNITVENFRLNGSDWHLQVPFERCPRMLIALKKYCPSVKTAKDYRNYDHLWSELMMCTTEFQTAKFFGVPDFFGLIEAVAVEQLSGLPSAIDVVALEEAVEIHQAMHEIAEGFGTYADATVAKLNSGQLFSTIYNELLEPRQETKMHIISSQDWIITSLLQSMDLIGDRKFTVPKYGALVTVEKWRDEDEESVKIFYREGVSGNQTVNPEVEQLLATLSLDEFRLRYTEFENHSTKEFCLETYIE